MVLAAADLVASDRHATVLLTGETGAGKGWLARRIHAASPRAKAPYLELNCASLDPALLESELFGHDRGAFTGADADKRGMVEVAGGGTLFLDEIAELPAAAQAKLLTFLDTRTFRRVGGTTPRSTDVRILAATNADLAQTVGDGRFRRDLYYRLQVFPLELPPLRERVDEIPALAAAIVADLAARRDRIPHLLGEQVLHRLVRHGWPGNVRELRNVLERAVILAAGGPIATGHLPPEIGHGPAVPGAVGRIARAEEELLRRALDETGGNRTHAAKLLGISRATIKRKLARLGAPAAW